MAVRRRSFRAPAVATALATLALSLASTAIAGAPDQGFGQRVAPKGPLSNTGRWITDARGRVVILHGLNMVYKLPPYEPGAVGFGADDAGFLRRNGFNTVRLGLIHKAVEPQPGQYDSAYIDAIRSTERMLAARGIFSLLDFHQDLYNEKFEGEGFADWAVLDDGLPAEPLTGFPASYLTAQGSTGRSTTCGQTRQARVASGSRSATRLPGPRWRPASSATTG